MGMDIMEQQSPIKGRECPIELTPSLALARRTKAKMIFKFLVLLCVLMATTLAEPALEEGRSSSASVKNAGAVECLENCNSYMNPLAHKACLGRCATDWKPSSKPFANPTLPVDVQMLPINPATLTQITEPITNILSQVIKRQHQIVHMIQSCTCVKPLTPFGQDNGEIGPYF